ncbi:MAG: iron-containing redox enzyme family protein [Pseudomonadota bacterium]
MSDEDYGAFALEGARHEDGILTKDAPSATPDGEGLARLRDQHFQRGLARFNAARLQPGRPHTGWLAQLQDEASWQRAEGQFIEDLRKAVASRLPTQWFDTDDFMGWFDGLRRTGPGQGHRLFAWLAEEASLSQMCWFLRQEAAGEAGFDDLLAMTQVKLPTRAKLEFARNYWDEMGHGKERAMHGEMLAVMVRTMKLEPAIETTVSESLALANAMLAMASTRRYALLSVGALGVIEMTAPQRVAQVSAGMKRLGLDGRMRAYFDLHAMLDVHHSKAWNSEVIRPLVESDPDCARFIGEGALIRLLCGEQCFERYSLELMPGIGP